MVFINSKLGNGFVINSVDSSRDQEHYFGGAKKYIRLALRGLSASLDLNNGNEFALTGTTNLELNYRLYDTQDAIVDTGSFSQRVFGIGPENIVEKFNAELTLQISASNTAFSLGDFNIEFRDLKSPTWSAYKGMKELGEFSALADSEGFFTYRTRFSSGSIHPPLIALSGASTDMFWRVTVNSAKIYTVKNVKIEFDQELTDDGVREYKTIDNQNVEFSFINPSTMPDIED